MKKTIHIFTFFLMVVALASCLDEYKEVFTANSPVYMTYDELRAAVKKSAPRDLKKPGKIYFKDQYIFINEELKGVHVINNANPASPQKVAFIEIPGSVDIAVKNNILYSDSYVDLVALDISNLDNVREVSRVKDAFPYTVPPTGNDYRMAQVDKEKGVVIDWEIKKVRQEMEYRYYPVYNFRSGAEKFDAASYTQNSGGAAPSGSTFGVGGSMARFGLYGDYLYTVDHSTLYLFDVKDAAAPSSIGKQNVGWNVETMFIYDNHLFFGTQNGMRIFSLAVATVPRYVGDFWHITSCDPVVISNGYAYITLRGGTVCGSNTNRLDVVKLSADYKNLSLIASYPLNGPYGLGIDGDILFVCDGSAGLKVYNVADKTTIDQHRIASFPNIKTYDVIPVNGFLFMIGDDGFYLYDYSNVQNIKQLSHIPVVK